MRHEYEEEYTRGDRKFDVIIVDEVDSMLIDGANHSTMLSTPTPGMTEIV